MLKDKYMKCLKASVGNNLIIRGERYTTFYNFTSPDELSQSSEIKTDLMGYQLSVTGEWALHVDQHRLIVLYHANKDRIIPVARYLAEK